jgi:hypothetical protein
MVPLYIPNLVLGQGTAPNQTFAITGATVRSLQIFTRWGSRVLDASPYAGDWRGKAGLYYFTAELDLPDGTQASRKGWVEVLE